MFKISYLEENTNKVIGALKGAVYGKDFELLELPPKRLVKFLAPVIVVVKSDQWTPALEGLQDQGFLEIEPMAPYDVTGKEITIKFPSMIDAQNFKDWFCGSGEQAYWTALEGKDVGCDFEYHKPGGNVIIASAIVDEDEEDEEDEEEDGKKDTMSREDIEKLILQGVGQDLTSLKELSIQIETSKGISSDEIMSSIWRLIGRGELSLDLLRNLVRKQPGDPHPQ